MMRGAREAVGLGLNLLKEGMSLNLCVWVHMLHGHALGGRKQGQKPWRNNPDVLRSSVRRNSVKYKLCGPTRRERFKRPFAAPQYFCKCFKRGFESFYSFIFSLVLMLEGFL